MIHGCVSPHAYVTGDDWRKLNKGQGEEVAREEPFVWIGAFRGHKNTNSRWKYKFTEVR